MSGSALRLLRLANARHGPEARHPGHDLASDHVHDHLADPRLAAAYLLGQNVGAPSTPPRPHQLVALRALAEAGVAPLRSAAAPLSLSTRRLVQTARFAYRPDGALVASGRGWDAFIASLVPELFTLIGLGKTMRRCANPRCRWLFVDASRNHSRTWCEMVTCGSRAKMRRYRARLGMRAQRRGRRKR